MLILSAVLLVINNRIEYVKKRLDAKIRLDVDDVCLRADYADIQSKNFTDRKNFALAAIKKGSLELVIKCLKSLLSSIITMIGTLWIISAASFFILIPLAISFLISIYYDYLNARQNFIDTKKETEYRKKSSYLQKISTDFQYAKEIRMFNLKDSFQGRMDEVEQLLYRCRESRRKKRKPSGFLIYSSGTILEIAIYLYFGFKVIVTTSITLGQFSLYSNALRQLKVSVNDIIYATTEFWVNIDYLDGLFGFIDLKKELPALSGEKLSVPQAQIRFENVSFRYPFSDCDALKNINITVNAGETLLVIGENGAGKSTLVKLLMRLYDPTEGEILINGVNIKQYDYDEYLSIFAPVFQDYKLFAFTVRENISSFESGNQEKVKAAASKSGIDDKIMQLSKKYETYITKQFDEEGVEFSGGEQQKIALARAYCKTQALITILDEPTSALDPRAEYALYQEFNDLIGERTAFFISHRLASAKFCDKIMVIKDKQVCEFGSHAELMQIKGYYYTLYNMQASYYL